MSNLERIAFAVCLLAGGVALGMYLEHERFLKELQGVAKKHADDPTPAKPPQAEASP